MGNRHQPPDIRHQPRRERDNNQLHKREENYLLLIQIRADSWVCPYNFNLRFTVSDLQKKPYHCERSEAIPQE
jgi:hypothetical protein